MDISKLVEDAAGLCERLEKRAAFWERYWTGRSLQDPDSGPIREAAALLRSLSLRVEAEKRAREEAQSYGGEARIRENAERAKFEEMRGRAEAAEARSAALAKALEYYATQLCEHSPDYEGCGKLSSDECQGCAARSLLTPAEGEDAE